MSKQLKYHLSFAELVDRLNVAQSKECYSGTDKYAQEIQDILHDIQVHLDSGIVVTAEMVRAIVILTQSNSAIWINEDFARLNPDNADYEKTAKALTYTHKLNGTRSIAKTWIQKIIGGRTDEKINCVAEKSAWKFSIPTEKLPIN